MALFKKKKEGEGVIPAPPEYEFPETAEMRKSIKNSKSSREIQELSEIHDMPELPEMPDIEQLDLDNPEETMEAVQHVKPKRLVQEIKPSKHAKESRASMPIQSRANEGKALFIKIEKFREILASVEEVSRRVQEIESMIGKIKDIRVKEDQAMENWEEELSELKSKLDLIDKTLSEKI